ncbi:unnamed protein product, partial [Prorocentrum cordatum]
VRIGELGEQLAVFQAPERTRATAADVDMGARALGGKIEALRAAVAEARSLGALAEGAARGSQGVANEHFRGARDPDSGAPEVKAARQARQDEGAQFWDPVVDE